jgi:hypothetical protein
MDKLRALGAEEYVLSYDQIRDGNEEVYEVGDGL